jgi:hypothetical protein
MELTEKEHVGIPQKNTYGMPQRNTYGMPQKNTYGMPHYLKESKDKHKKTICQHLEMTAPSCVEKHFPARPACKPAVGTSRMILYQIRHDALRGKWGYKLHAKAGFARSTQPMNIKLRTTNSPMQLD